MSAIDTKAEYILKAHPFRKDCFQVFTNESLRSDSTREMYGLQPADFPMEKVEVEFSKELRKDHPTLSEKTTWS